MGNPEGGSAPSGLKALDKDDSGKGITLAGDDKAAIGNHLINHGLSKFYLQFTAFRYERI